MKNNYSIFVYVKDDPVEALTILVVGGATLRSPIEATKCVSINQLIVVGPQSGFCHL